MEQVAESLHAAADTLATVDRALAAVSVPAGAFAADDAGLPGRLGRELHAHWSAVLIARAEEAAAAAAHLRDLAAAVTQTTSGYERTDRDASTHIERSSW
jgi:hypothetical protein